MAENREERDAGGGDGDTPDQASHLISRPFTFGNTHTQWKKHLTTQARTVEKHLTTHIVSSVETHLVEKHLIAHTHRGEKRKKMQETSKIKTDPGFMDHSKSISKKYFQASQSHHIAPSSECPPFRTCF